MDQVKGVITKCEYQDKYDLDGIKYKDYVFTVDKKIYTTHIKEKIYLERGMEVVLSIKPGTANEVVAGYCLKEDYTWGPKANALRNQTSQFDKWKFMEGTVVEKQKSTTGSIYMSRSFMSSRGSRISYTIVLDNGEFHASVYEGEYLQVGMNVAVVLDQNSPVIILDKDRNKYLGLAKPYFIAFLIAIVLFNGYMYYGDRTIFPNFKSVLIVINVFLVLALLLSIVTFRTTSTAKKFLLSKIGR